MLNPTGPTWAAGTNNPHHGLHQDPTRPISIASNSAQLIGLLVHQRPAKIETDGGK
jgi:hypothetical protein